MHYKNGRQNHDFQIAHFLVGSCHTADAAYALLQDQYEDRDNAIKMFEGSKLREQAKVTRAQAIIKEHEQYFRDTAPDNRTARVVATVLEAQADLSDIAAMRETTERNLAAAIAERAFIKQCMDKLEEYRVYRHLPAAEAAQAAQRDEWRLELMKRAENFLLTQGTIPHDHFDTMRMHPDFERIIFPHTNNIQMLLRSGKHQEALAYSLKQKLEPVTLLGLTYESREEVPALPAPTPNFARAG